MTKAEATAAYEAGKHSVSIVWGDNENVPQEKRVPGMHHCPFPVGDPQRAEYAKGLADALGGDQYDPAKILREVREEIKGGDNVSG